MAMKLFLILALAVTSLSACGRFPNDTEGTLDRVRGGELRVGLLHAGHEASALPSFLRRLSARTGSQIKLITGPAEPMLMKLENGEVDLVLGVFDRSSPWRQRITFSRAISQARQAGAEYELKAAIRNGEHAWAMEVDRVALAMSGRPE